MNKKKIIFYVCDEKLIDISRNIPNVGNRAAVLQSLISSYNLLTHCQVCNSQEATVENLLSFHSNEYIEIMQKVCTCKDIEKIVDSDEILGFNLGYDCPLFESIFDFAKLIAGSSLTAANMLISKFLIVKKKLPLPVMLNSQPKSYLKVKKYKKDSESFDINPSEFDEYTLCGEPSSSNIKQKENNKLFNYDVEISIPSNIQPISINWFGGWHHAQRDQAGGFCYVNDIVIAISYLLKYCKRILYIDLDVHHGDGVENAFVFSNRVLTLSLHKFEPGFYPTTGSLEEIGKGSGKYYTVNVPLKNGITDEKYEKIFKCIFFKIMQKYKPQCIVIQCGADCLAGDPMGGFNITPQGMGECLKAVLNEALPTLVLGGGGYNIINTSKCWTYLTSIIVNCPISNDIPDNPFLTLYGPEFDLRVDRSLRKDENSDKYIETILKRILSNLDNLPESLDKN